MSKTPAELQKNYRDRKRQTLIDNNARGKIREFTDILGALQGH